MAAVLVGGMWLLPAWAQGDMPVRLLRLAGLVTVGALSYIATLALLGFRLRHFARRAI